MAIASNSQLHFPTHSELRAIPVATWVYAAVGVVALVVAVASTFSLSVTSLLGSVEFVAPAFFAAAIAFVAV